MKFASIALMSVVATLLFAGCISTAPTELVKEGGIYQVIGHSMTLANTVRLTRRNVRINPNGFTRAEVEAVNLTRRDVQLQYRFRWLDAQSMRIDSATTVWKPVSLGARSRTFFESTSPTTDSRDFYMEVRFVHDTTRF